MEMLWTIFYVVFLGILSHFYGQALPRKWFNPEKFPYRSFKWEREGRIYRYLHIQKWQNKLPDMSRVMRDMVPKRMREGMTVSDVDQLIAETCVAEHVHVLLCLSFLLIAKFWQDRTWIPLWLIYTACNIPFILIQRYNRPMWLRVRNRIACRQEQADACRGAKEDHA